MGDLDTHEFDCNGCGYDFSEDQEKFYDKFAEEENHKEGFAAHNIKMLSIEDCTDDNSVLDDEKYEIEMTCPKCGAKKHHTDWSK